MKKKNCIAFHGCDFFFFRDDQNLRDKNKHYSYDYEPLWCFHEHAAIDFLNVLWFGSSKTYLSFYGSQGRQS